MIRRRRKKSVIEKQVDKRNTALSETTSPIDLISSGSTLFDLALGGGFPLGGVTNIAGEPSTGKTLLILEFIASAIRQYGDNFIWRYDDVETGMFFDIPNLFGFTPKEENFLSSTTVEDFDLHFDDFLKTIKKGQKALYVIDSLDGLTSAENLNANETRRNAMRNDKADKLSGSYNVQKQKFLSSSFFKEMPRKAKEKNCLLIVISQVRNSFSMFGGKLTKGGGYALDHQAGQIIWLSKPEKLKATKTGKKVTIGETIKVDIRKNKIGTPFRTSYLKILYNYGLDDISSNVDYLYNLITDSGKSRELGNVTWDDAKFKTKAKLVKYIEDKNQEKKLIKAVKVKYKEWENSLIPNRKRRF